MSRNNNSFFLGALFGGVVAGVAALLFAPKSGRELRDDIGQEMDELIDLAYDYTDYAVEHGSRIVDVASEAGKDIKINLQNTADHLKDQFVELYGNEETFIFNIVEYFNTRIEKDEIRERAKENLFTENEKKLF